MTIAERLKSETRDSHERTESLMFSSEIMNGSLTLSDYKLLIQTLLDFHFSFEDNVHSLVRQVLPKSFDLGKRKKLPALQHDANILKLGAHHINYSDTSSWKAVGWLYVMEGASLGGQVIMRKILANHAIAETGAYRFYEGYGNQTGPYWLSFKTTIDQTVPTEKEQEVVEGAQTAFNILGRCMEGYRSK